MTRQLTMVSNSELETWRSCHAKWGFRHAEGLEPALKPAALSFGSMYHVGIEAGWRAAWDQADIGLDARYERAIGAYPEALRKASAERTQMLDELAPQDPELNLDELVAATEEAWEVSKWAVGHYFEQAKADLAKFPLAIEHPFRVQVPDAGGRPNLLRLESRGLDLVLWDHELQQVRVDDHKTTAYSVQGVEKRLMLDTQLTGYVMATKQLILHGELPLPPGVTDREWLAGRVGGICYNVIRRAKPAKPKLNLLKKGECITSGHAELMEAQVTDGTPRGMVSVQAIDTLPEVYEAALLDQAYERELVVSEKQEVRLQELRAKGDTYFKQLGYYRGDAEIERWRKELWVESRRMRAARKDPSLRTRNPGHCTLPQSPTCVYAGVCTDDTPEGRRAFITARGHQEEEAHDDSTDGR